VFIEEAYQPATFRERGVSAPFTTPLLAGARLRAAPSRARLVLEIIIPNPAGGRGVYFVPWSERGDLCRPTVHDTRLGNTLAGRSDLALLCPSIVRQVGWVVAAEGHAGRAAAAAAQLALRDGAARFATELARLESALARHGAGTTAAPSARERLAALITDIQSPDGTPARLPTLIAAVGRLAPALTDWATAQSGPAAAAAQTVSAAAGLAHRGALLLLQAAVSRLNDTATFLRDWLADPVAVEQALSRADWLLDGWDRLVLLWQAALPGQAAAALEMAALLPVWPDEAEAWLGPPLGAAGRQMRRAGSPGKSWADPAIAVDQIARNERLRALGM
jgi:hypothetical protein